MRVFVYDTTLRDGTQGENVSFSVDDKLSIARKLDAIGIDYIEGGWPGSNPRDEGFFERAKTELALKHARLTAFGSTRHVANRPQDDENVRKLVDSETPVVTIFGKSWDLHTERALRVSEEQNREDDRLHGRLSQGAGARGDLRRGALLRRLRVEPRFCAAHAGGGATGGRRRAGALRHQRRDADRPPGGDRRRRAQELRRNPRIHTHNDSEMAVANAVAAVELGATHVQGTMNGYGERCGNCNLIPLVCNLELKLGHTTVGRENIGKMTSFANYIADMANLVLTNGAAFVGKSAFAHKGGIHVSAVLREASTYEHVEPETVGNERRVLVSDLSGRSNIAFKLQEKGWEEKLDDAARKRVLARIKQMEFEGYELGIRRRLFRVADPPGAGARDVFLQARPDAHGHAQVGLGAVAMRGQDDRRYSRRPAAG